MPSAVTIYPRFGRSQGENADMSPPRENVLSVPFRNVRLTSPRWGGAGTRSSHHDPAGQRPSGCTQEGAKETDRTRTGGARVGYHGAAGAAFARALEEG